MEYVCDAPDNMTWFRLVTEAEAAVESEELHHAVEKHFRRERERAAETFVPLSTVFFEQDIGREDHIMREMPLFVTLRDEDGVGQATAMLPPGGKPDRGFTPIVVGPANADPYPRHAAAIRALGDHFGLTLDRARCYPYRR